MSGQANLNPVRAQAILVHSVEQERVMADSWPAKWGFFKDFQTVLEKEAAKKGKSLAEFNGLSKEVSKGEEEFKIGSAGRSSFHVKGSPRGRNEWPAVAKRRPTEESASTDLLIDLRLSFPTTSTGVVGWRALLGPSLERFGRLVRSARDVPLNAALSRDPAPGPVQGHLYDPFKQTFVYTGVHLADPITYQLKPLLPTVPPNLSNKPLQYQLDRSPFNDTFFKP